MTFFCFKNFFFFKLSNVSLASAFVNFYLISLLLVSFALFSGLCMPFSLYWPLSVEALWAFVHAWYPTLVLVLGGHSHGIVLQNKTLLCWRPSFLVCFAITQPNHLLWNSSGTSEFLSFHLWNTRYRFCRKFEKYREVFKRKNAMLIRWCILFLHFS